MTQSPKPFLPGRPDYGATNRRGEANITSIARGLLDYARAGNDMHQAQALAREDRGAVAFLQRTAVVPANSTTTTTFNAGVVDTAVDILGPNNAAGAVFADAVKVTLGRDNNVWIPGLATDSTHVAFVGKNNPLRVLDYDVSKGTILTAGMKLGFGIVLTQEMISDSNAEGLLRLKMAEDIGAGLDALLFSNAAASAGVSPAGLLASVQTVTASAATVPNDALVADLGGLAEKVGVHGGNIVYVANIAEVTRIKARLPFFPGVFASGAVSTGNLIAIAPRGIAVAGSDLGPMIDTSKEGAILMDDALTNQQLTDSGSANFPLRSPWQTDSVVIRLLLPDLCWGQRVAAGSGGCVAALTGALKW